MTQPGARPSRTQAALVTLVSAVLGIAGCAVSHLSDDKPFEQVPDRSSAIRPGASDRAATQALLGAPLLGSAWWGFELYVAKSRQTETVFAVTPWPVPFAHVEDEILRYTLVSFGRDGRAVDVASGPFRRTSGAWRSGSPIQRDHISLYLRAGDVLMFADRTRQREVNLLAAPRLRDAYLARRLAAAGCTVVIGCGDAGCPDRVAIDSAAATRLPVRMADRYWVPAGVMGEWLAGVERYAGGERMPWLETLVALRLDEGRHELRFSAQHLAGEATHVLQCQRGERLVLTLHVRVGGSQWKPTLTGWRFDSAAELPDRMAQRALVLIDDGRWMVEPELAP